MTSQIPNHIIRVVFIDNPWLEEEPVDRWYAKFLPEKYIPRSLHIQADHRVCLVIGPRQTGKSTLLWKTLANTGRPCLYLNCEEPSIREWLKSPAVFLADINTVIDNNVPILFEEIQHLDDAGLFLKGLADRRSGRLFYATGSSAFDLEAKTRESLAGRALRHLLLPLSLDEVVGDLKLAPALHDKKSISLAGQLILYGGYPPVFTSETPRTQLTGLVEAFIIRDASDRLKIRHPVAFRKLFELIASQIGNLCNYSEWAAVCGVSSDTVREYAGILENSHIVRLIRPYVGGKRAEITSTPKAYFLDNGIRNQVFGGFSSVDSRPDRGSLLENFVFTEIYKTINPLLDTVRFWRSKSGAEVDFVVERQGRITAWEVKAGASRSKLTRSVRSFIDAYQPARFYIVSEVAYPDQHLGKTHILFIPFNRVAKEARRDG